MLDRNKTAARLKSISSRLVDSWANFNLTNDTKQFHAIASLNPIILKEANDDEAKTFDQSITKCIYSKQVRFLKNNVSVVKFFSRL